MKIAYLHGLESSIDKKDPKIIFMNDAFDEVYAPSINYKDNSIFNKLLNDIKKFQPDLIVGSSMGGYVSYLIGSKLSIETILFNPAMVGRSFDPTVDNSSLKGSTHNVYFGKSDKVIDGDAVKTYFNEEGIGNFKYNYYNGEHRVPVDVFISAIKNVLRISEINNIPKTAKGMKHVKLFEDFLNESKNIDSSFERIDNLPKGSTFEDAKKIDGIFNRSKYTWSEVIETFEKHQKEAKIKSINIKDIRITQPNIQSNKVKAMIHEFSKLPSINVVQFSDELAIYDGHHRLLAAWSLGETKIKVNLIKA